MATQFIKLNREVSIGLRTYPEGSVVEVDKYRRKELVDREHAEDHPGPAFEPDPIVETADARRRGPNERRG